LHQWIESFGGDRAGIHGRLQNPASVPQAAEKVEKQIPRRPEGLLVMTKTKGS
jgi:hypothetical protein